MKTVNSVERKRITKRFAGFYAVSMALLAVIFAALTLGNSDKPLSGPPLIHSEISKVSIAEQEEILSASGPLQSSFRTLLEYDEEYAALIKMPGSDLKLERLRVNIENAELQVDKAIAGLQEFQKGFTAGAGARILERITSTYKAATESRKNTNKLRDAIAAGSTVKPDQQAISKLSTEMISKDKRIAELEQLVARTANVDKAGQAGILEENANLRAAVEDARKNSGQATEQVATFKKENIRLSERINDLQRNSVPVLKPEVSSVSKIESLTADLSFSQVDCNLTRADAKQIISNARQRRELLGEALKILNTLAKSGNADIRRKAGEKIASLNYIANNIRE